MAGEDQTRREPAAEPEPETPKRVREADLEVEVFDKRAVTLGLVISVLLALLAVVYRLSTDPYGARRRPPLEFEFSVAEPAVEEFNLRPPVREILQERPETMQSAGEGGGVAVEEIPNIHVTTNPSVTAPQEQQFIQSSNISIDTPKIEIGGTEIGDVTDAPQEITQIGDTVSWQIPVIGALSSGPADLIKYKDPTPPDKPATHFITMGPRPGRPVKLLPKAWGRQDLTGPGTPGSININLNGLDQYFRPASRFGDLHARSSVDSALHWLAAHQDSDGLWHAEKWEGEQASTMAVTGLAVLAFMGAGNTTRKGEYMRSVLRGVEALVREQDAEGGWYKKAPGIKGGYTQGICTIALCEAYGRARDERVGLAAQKAVQRCEKAVNSDGGWRYQPNQGPSDMSVSAWFVQALKTAKLSQLKFDSAIFSQGLSFVDSVTDKGASKDSNGAVTYQFQPGQDYGNGHPALTAAGMMVRQFSGMGVKNHILIKGAELTRGQAPTWTRKDFYLWYYATYSMHNMGGEFRLWWNKRIRDVLLDNQVRTGEDAGSWDPKGDKWASHAGRAFTTALGALCLEVYYRYSEALTSFGTAPELDELFFEQ
jgi:hypothetical protein